jgi:hypothetical protein
VISNTERDLLDAMAKLQDINRSYPPGTQTHSRAEEEYLLALKRFLLVTCPPRE